MLDRIDGECWSRLASAARTGSVGKLGWWDIHVERCVIPTPIAGLNILEERVDMGDMKLLPRTTQKIFYFIGEYSGGEIEINIHSHGHTISGPDYF